MKVEQRRWTQEENWEFILDNGLENTANLVIAFGSRNLLEYGGLYKDIKDYYINAHIMIASTSGEILDLVVSDNSITVTAIKFEDTPIQIAKVNIQELSGSYLAGQLLSNQLPYKNLKHVFVLSDGLLVDGTELLKGLRKGLPANVSITGGLAGDATSFKRTLVGINEIPDVGNIGAVGLYGDKIKVGYGSVDGWETYGKERIVTKSEGNILYELDNQPALQLYKSCLGKKAEGLPATGLSFPLAIQKKGEPGRSLVRTILAIDEEKQSLTFAGIIPQGSFAHFMKTNFANLIAGAKMAAQHSIETIETNNNKLAILISNVGRKNFMGQWIGDEIDAANKVLGNNTVITGYYSYGELAPSKKGDVCNLHNQTMTITLLAE
jgi:hypothetical protein